MRRRRKLSGVRRHETLCDRASLSALPDNGSLDVVARTDGAQYILNSAIPHEGQELTPPGLYGPWGTVDNPGWHGDYTIVRSNAALLLPPFRRSSP